MSKLYEEWLEVSAQLRTLKAKELKLRDKIVKPLLEDKLEGAATSYKKGYKVTATARVNRTLDRELLEAIWEDLPLDARERRQTADDDEEHQEIGGDGVLREPGYRPLAHG